MLRAKGTINVAVHLMSILILFLMQGVSYAMWPFGPSNAQDCILKYQKKT
jgi:hypothetical protein